MRDKIHPGCIIGKRAIWAIRVVHLFLKGYWSKIDLNGSATTHAFPVFKICGFIYWPGFSVESDLCLKPMMLIGTHVKISRFLKHHNNKNSDAFITEVLVLAFTVTLSLMMQVIILLYESSHRRFMLIYALRCWEETIISSSGLREWIKHRECILHYSRTIYACGWFFN